MPNLIAVLQSQAEASVSKVALQKRCAEQCRLHLVDEDVRGALHVGRGAVGCGQHRHAAHVLAHHHHLGAVPIPGHQLRVGHPPLVCGTCMPSNMACGTCMPSNMYTFCVTLSHTWEAVGVHQQGRARPGGQRDKHPSPQPPPPPPSCKT